MHHCADTARGMKQIKNSEINEWQLMLKLKKKSINE